MNTNDDLRAEYEGRPAEAAAWELIGHACRVDRDRQGAIEAVATDVALLQESGQLDAVTCQLVYLCAKLLNFDEIAAEHEAARAGASAEFAAIMVEAMRTIAAEEGKTLDI